jgi:hypothetical protein
MKRNTSQPGFSLVEMLIYVALLTLIFMAIVNIALSFTSSYSELGALRAAEHTGFSSMERLVRDIHLATTIDVGQSSFATTSGALALTSGTTTTRFFLSDGVLRVSVDGVDIGPLSVGAGKITSLMFNATSTAESQAVKIEMVVRGEAGKSVREKKYITTAILKNS